MTISDAKSYHFLELYSRARDRTLYLLQDSDGQLYSGQCSKNIEVVKRIQPNGIARLPKRPLHVGDFFPRYESGMTKFHGDPTQHPDVFIKRQQILSDVRFPNYNREFRKLTKREIEMCERLDRHPHINICKYMGVVVDKWSRATGIAYRRYDTDLHDFVSAGKLLSSHIGTILSDVRKGMSHMHGLGLVHCDLRPPNIFLKLRGDEIEEAAIGDFDATVRVGHKIEFKISSEEWWSMEYDFGHRAEVEIDEYSFRKLKPWLKRYAKTEECMRREDSS